MQYDKELIAHKLDRWDRFITDYHLPEWDSIPDLGLYMDQVVLLAQYLNFIPAMPGGKESFVTSSTINNYVRLKIMPAPVKRKYFRVHIAYLIMILTMKQSISISDVQKIIPADIPEEEVRATYQEYSEKFRHIALFFNQQVQDAAERAFPRSWRRSSSACAGPTPRRSWRPSRFPSRKAPALYNPPHPLPLGAGDFCFMPAPAAFPRPGKYPPRPR